MPVDATVRGVQFIDDGSGRPAAHLGGGETSFGLDWDGFTDLIATTSRRKYRRELILDGPNDPLDETDIVVARFRVTEPLGADIVDHLAFIISARRLAPCDAMSAVELDVECDAFSYHAWRSELIASTQLFSRSIVRYQSVSGYSCIAGAEVLGPLPDVERHVFALALQTAHADGRLMGSSWTMR